MAPVGVSEAATGSVLCIAEHVGEADGGERVHVMHVRYDDRYRRVDRSWRVAERRLKLLFDEDHPVRS